MTLGRVQLVPYVRGVKPGILGTVTQTMIDAVLGNYANHEHFPTTSMGTAVNNATIVHWLDDDRENLDEDGVADRLRFGQSLTMAALSARQFGSHMRYCNADGVAMVGQHFDTNNPGGVSFSTRRRDGNSNTLMSGTRGRPYFLRPIHVFDPLIVELDVPLLLALERIDDYELKMRIFDAISLFNYANTDASAVTQSAEIVMLRAAFETLLNTSHQVADLRCAFAKHFSDLGAVIWHGGEFTEGIWRGRWPKDVGRPLDAWVLDFCHSRNASAHGTSHTHSYPSAVWSLHNHLMFASWLFPLVVKGVMANAGVFKLSELDKDHRAEFEQFFATDVCSCDSEGKFAWGSVLTVIEAEDFGRTLASFASDHRDL